MRKLIATLPRRLGWSIFVFSLASGIALWSVLQAPQSTFLLKKDC